MRAVVLTVLGFVSIETGLVCSPWPWTAPIVGGAASLWLGLVSDIGKDTKAGDS